MKFIIIFLTLLYLVTAIVDFRVYKENIAGNAAFTHEVAALRDTHGKDVLTIKALEKKAADAQINGTFLTLALCPTLETLNKNALCIKNGAEWLSQTITAGTALTDPDAKAKMDLLLTKLEGKSKPTAKQLYEMLRPVESASLKALIDDLKYLKND